MIFDNQKQRSGTVKSKVHKASTKVDELKANATSPAKERMQLTHSESATSKAALMKGPSNTLGSPAMLPDEKKVGEDQNSAFAAQEHAVFYQKQTALKDSIVLSQNEVRLLDNLKERLVGIMRMGPDEFKSMMNSQYGEKPGKPDALLGRKSRKP